MAKRSFTKQTGAAPVTTQPQVAQPTAGKLTFRWGKMEDVPKFTPGNVEKKYREIEEALRGAAKGKPMAITVPADIEPQKFASNVLSAIRRAVPETRSRCDEKGRTLWLWRGEVKTRKANSTEAGS